MAIGAGRIDPFVAAELALILVAGTVRGGACRLWTDNKHDGHCTSSWSDIHTFASRFCPKLAALTRSSFRSMAEAVATTARAARMIVANYKKGSWVLPQSSEHVKFNAQTFILKLVYCGAGEEKLFAEGFACWTCPFYTLSDREFITEKILRSPVHAAEIRVRYWVLLIIVQVIVSCVFEIYWGKMVDTTTLSNHHCGCNKYKCSSISTCLSILPIFHESSAHSAGHQNGFDFIHPPALSDIVTSSSWDHWKWLSNFRKKTTTFWYWKN